MKKPCQHRQQLTPAPSTDLVCDDFPVIAVARMATGLQHGRQSRRLHMTEVDDSLSIALGFMVHTDLRLAKIRRPSPTPCTMAAKSSA